MSRTLRIEPQRLAKPAALALGERLRQLRVAAGLTQGELAGDRFSKEYVSQIERGKTRPTAETIEWLAKRLDVDTNFLANGVSTDERGRVEAGLARAEALMRADRIPEALDEFEALRSGVLATGSPELEARALAGEARARAINGEVRQAIPMLERARSLTEGPSFSDVERAEVIYELGVARYKLSSVSTALALFNAALELCERSNLPSDVLRSKLFEARSRCYRRQRDFEAAKEDVERALELAESAHDQPALAHALFQASLVAEREGHWVLARSYAERAKSIYEELAEQRHVGRLLNVVGGLNFLLGKPDEAIRTPEGVVPHRARPRARGRRGDGGVVARPGAPAHRRTSTRPRSRRATRSASSTAASTGSTRSGTPSSSSVARCSSRAGSTRRRSSSARRTPPSSSTRRSATAPRRGSPSATSPRAAETTAMRRTSTAAPPRRSRTSASSEGR